MLVRLQEFHRKYPFTLALLSHLRKAERHANAKDPLLAWYREVQKADWDTPAKVKGRYPNASILADNRVVFNIKGDAYRLVVKINYPGRIVYVRFVGTHADYDRVNVREV